MPSIEGRVMVVAFEGWNDAGEAASSAVRRLIEACELEPIDEVEPDDFVDFSFARPIVRRLEDGTRSLAWPSTIAYAPTRSSARTAIADDAGLEVSTGAEGDLYALLGAEPSRSWQDFAEQVVDIARTCEIDTLVLVGAMLADVPHTRPTPTYVSSDSRALRERLDVGESEYEGPTGIMTVIELAAQDAGIPSVNLWASVPHYVHATHVPKATIALLDRITELCDVTVPLEELPELAADWESGVDDLADRDDDMRAYIEHLEQQRDTVDSPEASGEALAKEFQRFLENQPGRTEPGRATAQSDAQGPAARDADRRTAGQQDGVHEDGGQDESADEDPADDDQADDEPGSGGSVPPPV